MTRLKGFQKRYLRGLGHDLNPVILIGKAGLSPSVINAIDAALGDHELIKLRFLELREAKKEVSGEIEDAVQAEMVGMVGHTALFFRQKTDIADRKVHVPER